MHASSRTRPGEGVSGEVRRTLHRRSVLQLGTATLAAASVGPITEPRAQSPLNEIVTLDGTALADAIRTRQLSCVEVMNAYLGQIDRLNPHVNAIVALQDRDVLLRQARDRGDQLARGEY